MFLNKDSIPRHAVGTVTFNSDSLKNCLDIGNYAWSWKAYKTPTCSKANIREKASHSVCDRLE